MTKWRADCYGLGVGNTSQQAAYAIFDDGYYGTWDGGSVMGLRHVSAPDTIISLNNTPATSNIRTGSDGNGHNYMFYNSSSATTTYKVARINRVGTSITFTELATHTGITQGNGWAGGDLKVDPTNQVIHVKSYYSSSNNPPNYQQFWGFSTSTGAMLYNWTTNTVHPEYWNLGFMAAVSPNKILLECNPHGVHLVEASSFTILATMPSYRWPQSSAGYLVSSAAAVVSENQVVFAFDTENPHIGQIGAALYDVSAGSFSKVRETIWTTDWNRLDPSDDLYPTPFAWTGSDVVFIASGITNYSGEGWNQAGVMGSTYPMSCYLFDTTTGDVYATEPTTHLGDGFSFWSSGSYMAGRCGANYVYLANQVTSNNPQVTYQISATAPPDANLYYRTLDASTDTLSWKYAEQVLPTDWSLGSVITPIAVADGKVAVGLGQAFGGSDAQPSFYLIDTTVQEATPSSTTSTYSALKALGFGTNIALSGAVANAQVMHNWVLSTSVGSYTAPELAWGPSTFSLWGLCAGALPPLRLGARNDGEGISERHGRINTVRQEWSSDRGNRLQYGQKGTYQ